MDQAIRYSNKQTPITNVTDSLVLTIIIATTVWFVQWLWHRRMFYYYTWNVKGPLSFPFIGTMYRFASARTTNDIMKIVAEIQMENPELHPFWYGPKLWYGVSKPEHVEKILTSPHCLNKGDEYRFVSDIADGLLTLPGHKWKRNRKLINPSFNTRILDSFVEIFEKQALILSDQMQRHIGKSDLDISHLLANCTLDMICETAMGVEVNAQTSEVCDLARAADRLMELTALRMVNLLYHPNFIWNLLPISKEYRKHLETYKKFCGNIIRQKLLAHQQKIKFQKAGLNADVEKGGSKKIKAFLDLLLEDGNLNEEELNAEVSVFIIAGTDTTSLTLSAVFMCLGIHPDIQEKVYQEIIGIMGHSRRIDPCDFSKMKYMEMVIKETLRLFPVAPFFSRSIGEDLDLGEVILAKGSSAVIHPFTIHRSPHYWNDPLKFDPDRFLPENVATRHPCSYIPFAYGPRNCIGGRYAMRNVKTILSTILRRYRFTSGYKSITDVDINFNLTLRFTHGTRLNVHER